MPTEYGPVDCCTTLTFALDEIDRLEAELLGTACVVERLEKENERLRGALQTIVRSDALRLRNRELVDMTPDEGMVTRILSAYIDESYWTDNTAGAEPENPVCKLMNENREKRNVFLRAALQALREGADHA